MSKNLETLKAEGIRVHGPDFVHPGDTVEAICNVQCVIKKGTRLIVSEIKIECAIEGEAPKKRLILEGQEKDFNPQRFRKVN